MDGRTGKTPGRLVVDIDAMDAEVHGGREGGYCQGGSDGVVEARAWTSRLDLPKDSRLEEETGWNLSDTLAECERKGRAAWRCRSFRYAHAEESW